MVEEPVRVFPLNYAALHGFESLLDVRCGPRNDPERDRFTARMIDEWKDGLPYSSQPFRPSSSHSPP